jgi:amidohydrolase
VTAVLPTGPAGPVEPAELTELADNWRAALADELPGAVRLRHELHAEPEVSGEEERTAARVAAALDAGGLVAQERVALTGRVLRIGPAQGPAVLVRAELDALPIVERTGAAFAAMNGAMHACGHDVHLAALVALARSAQRPAVAARLPAALLAVLQPREEAVPSGAPDVVSSGLLEVNDVRAAVAAHVQPQVADGLVAVDGGPVNAAIDEFDVVVTGRGGHGAYPHLALDPVPALCRAVLALQDAVRRTVDPMRPAVLTVSRLGGAEAPNVIPERATATGTMRTMTRADADAVGRAMRETVAGIAAAHGCTGEVVLRRGDPALVNDHALAAAARRWLRTFGAELAPPFASCGSDDFAWYGQAVPVLMAFAGTGDADGAGSLHDPRFLPADARVGEVARALLAGYLAAAGEPGQPGPP